MEERSLSGLSATMSTWKLRQEGLKNQRNYRQLQNRLIILQLQKQGKMKSIDKKLQAHKKLMEVRMDRFRLKEQIDQHDQKIDNQATSNSRIFKQLRTNRMANLRTRSTQMRQTNHRLFKEIKRQREENEMLIRDESQKELRMKTGKRNKVRLIEIGCKENVDRFWKKKLEGFESLRENEISRNLEREERKMQFLINLQNSEAELLSQIKRTEEMETRLVSMMVEERSIINAAISNRIP